MTIVALTKNFFLQHNTKRDFSTLWGNMEAFCPFPKKFLAGGMSMRHRFIPAPTLGAVPIHKIELDITSRHKLVLILMALQHLYVNCFDVLDQILELISCDISSDTSADNGRAGMTLWDSLVMASIRLGCDFSYDHLAELASNHIKLRQMLGLSHWDDKLYKRSTIHGNLTQLSPETIKAIDRLIVGCGHALCSSNPLKRVRFDSFVLDKDIHYPTDTSLIFDGVRKSIEISRHLADIFGILGWRQHDFLKKKAKRTLRKIGSIAKSKAKDKETRMKAAYIDLLEQTERILDRSEKTIQAIEADHKALLGTMGHLSRDISDLQYYLGATEYVCDLARRRVLEGETIPNSEKVFSIFEPDTELINRGKKPTPIEFGHRVLIGQDSAGFILHSQVMGIGVTDEKTAVDAVDSIHKHFNKKILIVSFDKGFWKPKNLEDLSERVSLAVLPRKGKCSAEDKARENARDFIQTRKWHSGIESAIHGLVAGNGMDVCRDKGLIGYRRYTAMAVLGRNLNTLGNILLEKERKKQQRNRAKAPLAGLVA